MRRLLKRECSEEGEQVQSQKPQKQKREQEGEELIYRNWSEDLPSDVVSKISSCCRSSGDRVRLAAVCTPWRRSALAAGKIAKISHPPWLLLPRDTAITTTTTTTCEKPRESQVLYSFSDRKPFPVVNPLIDLPQLHTRRYPNQDAPAMRCIGSGVGWMVTVSNFTADLQLHDLVTNSITSLPPLSSFRDVRKVFDKHGNLTGYTFGADVFGGAYMVPSPLRNLETAHYFYNRAVFFPHHLLVFLICNDSKCLAFARVGQHSWSICVPDLQTPWVSVPHLRPHWVDTFLRVYSSNIYYQFVPWSDVVFHKGNFYVVDKFGWIMEINLSSVPNPTCKPLRIKPWCPAPPVYLVEVEDELMLVSSCPSYPLTSKVKEFTVYRCPRLNEGKEGKEDIEWVEVKDLGQWVLFVGDNQALALSSKELPELSPNSIYFVLNRMSELGRRCYSYVKMGIFHLETGVVQRFPFAVSALARNPDWPPPIWIPHGDCFQLLAQASKEYCGSKLLGLNSAKSTADSMKQARVLSRMKVCSTMMKMS